MTNEVWRPAPGYEGKYEVSNLGRVKSLRRLSKGRYGPRTVPERILRPGRNKSGHVSVALGRGNSKMVHALVLLAFVGPAPPRHEVLHLNHTPDDNRLSNLKYGTRSENLKMDYASGNRTACLAWVNSVKNKRKAKDAAVNAPPND